MFWKYYFTWNLSSYCELLSSLTHTHTDTSGLGELFASSSSSIRYGDSPSISAAPTPSSSWSSSWLWLDGGSHGNQTVQATAWGLVIVTATLIRRRNQDLSKLWAASKDWPPSATILKHGRMTYAIFVLLVKIES
jgi:hypothetical protein